MSYNEYKDVFIKLKEIVNTTKNKNITILIHKNPDGDAIGAALAFSIWLQKNEFNVKIVSPNYFNDAYMFLPNIINVFVYESLFKTAIIKHINESELIFFLDFNQSGRINEEIWDLIYGKKSEKKICIIDHHPTMPEKNYFMYIDTSATSTCEILYNILSHDDIDSRDIAECLYVGILSDTGKFSTPNVTSKTHAIISNILDKYSINVGDINKKIYGYNSLKKLKFLGYILFKKLKTIPDYSVAYIAISKEDTEKYHLKPGDTDGIVNYALSLKNVTVAAMFNEKKDGIYISFRSIGDFAVNDFSEKNFNGGGHKNAAGGFSKKNLKETINNFINLIKNFNILKYGEKK